MVTCSLVTLLLSIIHLLIFATHVVWLVVFNYMYSTSHMIIKGVWPYCWEAHSPSHLSQVCPLLRLEPAAPFDGWPWPDARRVLPSSAATPQTRHH